MPSVEGICSNIKDARAVAKRTYEAAVELFAMLCEKYGLNPTADGVIISHKEGYYRTRKTWKDAKSQKGAYKVLQNAKECADKYEGYSVFANDGKKVYDSKKTSEYRVRVDIPDLNIRRGPGTHMAKTGEYTGKGVFTIVAESIGLGSKKGWGKLKSGKGWISLDYADRV